MPELYLVDSMRWFAIYELVVYFFIFMVCFGGRKITDGMINLISE